MNCKKLHYSVCIDAVFRESNLSFTEAMRAIWEIGFEAFEFWSWQDKDIAQIRQVQKDTGLKAAAFCTEFVNPGDRLQQTQYLEGLRRSIQVAQTLECGKLIVQAGWEYETAAKGITKEEHRKAFLDTVYKAGEIARQSDIVLLIEPLNLLVDHPGYHLSTSEDAFNLVNKIGLQNVQILFDIYHQQITEGNLTQNMIRNIEHIGHFHAAAVPGRGDITTGEICYPFLLKKIAESGYAGYVGLEYMPVSGSESSLQSVWNDILL